MFREIKIIFRKETKDHLRDKRSLILSMIFPLLAPILVGVLLYFVNHSNIGASLKFALEAPIAGQENAPELMAFFESRNVTPRSAPQVREFQESAVKKGDLPFVLVIPEEAQGKKIFSVELIIDKSSPKSMGMASNMVRLITIYSRLQGMQMLETAGLDPGMATPITLSENNVGKALNTAFLFYNMIPSLLMFMIFMGAVYLAIDVSVGERERGSLETLLITPVSRVKVLLAKSLTALVFTMMIVALNLLAFYVALTWATSGTGGAITTPPPGPLVFLLLFGISIPLMIFAVSLQMIIAFMTRSAKEAQIYLGLLPIIPLVPGLVMVFNTIEPTPAISAIPIYGQLVLFIDIIAGKGIDWTGVAYSVAGTASFAYIVFFLAAKLFEREKTVLGAQ